MSKSHQPSKPVSIINSFEGLEEELDGVNTNVMSLEKIAKSPSILFARDNFSSLSQLLKEIAAGEYEIKVINKQIKIQP
jgi:hypothetical protein